MSDTSSESWRCFHCGENFTDRYQAELHFGRHWQVTQPMCTLDAEYVRRLERQLDAWNNEDTELHRKIESLNAEIAVKVRRAEEHGYARGLRDAMSYLEELGLRHAVAPAISQSALHRPIHGGQCIPCVVTS